MVLYCVYSKPDNKARRVFTNRVKMNRFLRTYRLFHQCDFFVFSFSDVTPFIK